MAYQYHLNIRKETQFGTTNAYLVRLNDNRRVVIKKCAKDDRRGISVDTLREGTILKLLSNNRNQHPHVIKLLAIEDDDNYHYIVIEPMDESLREFMPNAKHIFGSDEDVIKVFLKQILSGLCYCHDHNVIHRDLKPENLLVKKVGHNMVFKITDFGWAKHLGIPSGSMTPEAGTLSYKAQEMLSDDLNSRLNYSFPVDMWAVGCIFAEMATGEILFPDHDKHGSKRSESKLLDVITRQVGNRMLAEAGILSSDGLRFLGEMLKMDPTERITARDAFNHEYLRNTRI